MKTSDGLECEHEDQLIPGLCACCDKWGETHSTCFTCSCDLDDEDASKEFIHEGADGQHRCSACHDAHERNAARERARDAYEAHCDQKLGEWKDEGRRGRP